MNKLSPWSLSLAALVLLAGCGGGGGGASRKVSATILWPQRSKVLNAPSSALSVTFVLAQTGSPSITWTRNRSADTAAHQEVYESDKSFDPGPYTLTATFFSQADGVGSIVGQATTSVTVTETGADVGDVAVGTRVFKVTVDPNQSVAVGAEKEITFKALDNKNALIAVSPGSAVLQVVVGTDSASVVENRIKGVALGLTQVKATVDGVFGTGIVGVGTPAYSVNATGARGQIPIAAADGATYNVDGTTSAAVTSGWFGTNTAPARYADRAFAAWKVGATTVSTNPVLTGLPGNIAGQTLTATYTASAPSGGVFTPNYNTTDFGFWQTLPVKVWIDPAFTATMKTLIVNGITRWKTASGGAIDFTIVTDQAQGQIKIVPHTSALATAIPTGRKGITTTTGTPVGALIRLSASTVTIRGDEPTDSAQNQAVLTALASHEFGHALGIIGTPDSGHSTVAIDTMFPTATQNTRAITERDINTIANIYPDRFGLPGRAVHRSAAGPEVTRVVACP